jgi:hypothetical protein
MKILLKSLAALLFLALSIWAIRSDSLDERGGVSPASASEAGEARDSRGGPPPGNSAWRKDALWDDGKAEFCAYGVTWAHYGRTYNGRALLILVKEPWNEKLDVKADDAAASSFDVLKLNHVRDVPTGIYTYHQMASTYLRRDSGAIRKVAATSSEACGVSTSEVARGGLETRSYFDGQGDRSLPWPVAALPEDGLPASLRDYVTGEAPAELTVFPSLMQSRFPELEPAVWKVARKSVESNIADIANIAGIEIRLTRGDESMAYTFDAAAPHRLLRLDRSDGTVYTLAKCERIAYWEKHNPGDEAWLPDAVR